MGCDVNGVPGFIDTSGFDFTTGLGSITATISGVGSHFFDVFVDHEIDESLNSFFNEYGTAHNTAATGQTWEIDEPGFVFGDIYDNFLDSSFDNFNNIPQGFEEDVSMGLGWDFNLLADETAEIMFLLSLTEPTVGFYLSHTDPDSSDETIYFSSTLDIQQVPVPAAIWLFGTGFLLLIRNSVVRKT